jgi:hypothetical protein
MVLVNSTLSSNLAGYDSYMGSLGGAARTPGFGGGIAANSSNASVELQGATMHNNTAATQGGGLWLSGGSKLVVSGPVKTHVFNNKAGTLGGGLRLNTSNFTPSQLTDKLQANNNYARSGDRDISVVALRVDVLEIDGADRVVASDDGEATLAMTFNVSGPHGWPSDDRIYYSLSNVDVMQPVVTFVPVNTTADGDLRKLRLGFRQPPGGFVSAAQCVWSSCVQVVVCGACRKLYRSHQC